MLIFIKLIYELQSVLLNWSILFLEAILIEIILPIPTWS